MNPILRIGSRNDQVTKLQSALNLWQTSILPPLVVDGIFGIKTDAKVREYQKSNHLVQDGIVGPKTWEVLKPLIDEILSHIKKPSNESAASELIALAAETALTTFGWLENSQPNPASPRIAAAICADPSNPIRPRQGGFSLLSIFSIGGAPANYLQKCTSITKKAEEKWKEQSIDATIWRNQNDLPAWCGIFCYYVYRCAGINLGGWINHKKNSITKFRSFINPADAFRGCIGVIDGFGGKNHHFIVIDNDKSNSLIRSIDGNTSGSFQDTLKGLKSTISRRSYSYENLKKEQVYFLFPKHETYLEN